MGVAKGLAFSKRKPLIAVNTLLAQATAAQPIARFRRNLAGGKTSRILVPIIAGRRNELYTAKFVDDEPLPRMLTQPAVMNYGEFSEWLEKDAIVCGNAVSLLREQGFLRHCSDSQLVPGDSRSAGLSGGLIASIGQIKLAAGEVSQAESVEPFYVQQFQTGVAPASATAEKS